MNAKQLVKLSNLVGGIAIILLIYWVFTFITLQVFGLKVFRENITETFYMSVLGILALMLGALIINVMFNLTRIAEKHNEDESYEKSTFSKSWTWLLALSFPIILGLLFWGDYSTAQKKEEILIESASSILENHHNKTAHFLSYKFGHTWINETGHLLRVLSKTDKSFPEVSILVQDTLDGASTFLVFKNYRFNYNDSIPLDKENFILPTTVEERAYLHDVFQEGNRTRRYTAHDGHYELFFPYQEGEKQVVFYFSDHNRFGKIGSY